MANNSFDEDSTRRIAAAVKDYERPNAGFDAKPTKYGSKPQVHRAVKIMGAFNVTRQQYPGRFVTYTPGTGGIATWVDMDTNAPSGQDCWVVTQGRLCEIGDVLECLLVYGEDTDGRPVMLACELAKYESYIGTYANSTIDSLDYHSTIVAMTANSKPGFVDVLFTYGFEDVTPYDNVWIDDEITAGFPPMAFPVTFPIPVSEYRNRVAFCVRRYLTSGTPGDASDVLIYSTGYIDEIVSYLIPLVTYDPVNFPDDYMCIRGKLTRRLGNIQFMMPSQSGAYTYYLTYYIEPGRNTIQLINLGPTDTTNAVQTYIIKQGTNETIRTIPLYVFVGAADLT